jgi:hypothetical protein
MLHHRHKLIFRWRNDRRNTTNHSGHSNEVAAGGDMSMIMTIDAVVTPTGDEFGKVV